MNALPAPVPLKRRLWVVLHRWAGLSIALFLVIAGVTGSVLPFEEELTFASRPDAAHAVPPRPGARPLDGVTIAERVERATGAAVPFVTLDVPDDHVVRMFVTARPGRPALPYDTVWADPYTGEVRLTYRWGGVSDGIVNVVPFLYSLHYGFIAGEWGRLAFGIAALVWTIDCFVGFYLTWPIRRVPHRDTARWFARWRPAWRVRRARGHKLAFDLHRAGALWLWPLLFVFAWSAVALSLPQVARPVMRVFGAEPAFESPTLTRPVPEPSIAMRDAIKQGTIALARIGLSHGFAVERLTAASYDPASGLYRLMARTSLDSSDAAGLTTLWLDGRNGRAVRFDPPQGRTAADAFVTWIEYLHMAEVFGLPYRILVSMIGLAVTALTVTGVLIWMKKRSARLLGRRRTKKIAGLSQSDFVAAKCHVPRVRNLKGDGLEATDRFV